MCGTTMTGWSVARAVEPAYGSRAHSTAVLRTRRRREASRPIRRGRLVRRMSPGDLIGRSPRPRRHLQATTWAQGHYRDRDARLLPHPAWVVVAKLYGLYDHDEERTDHLMTDDLVPVLHLVTVGTWLFFAVTSVTRTADASLPRLFVFWLLAIIIITAGRAIARTLSRRTMSYVQNTIIVGAGDVGRRGEEGASPSEYGLNLVGFVDDEPKERPSSLNDLALLGGPEKLPARADPRRRAGDRGLLERPPRRGDARPHPLAEGSGHPDRPGASVLRGDRDECRNSTPRACRSSVSSAPASRARPSSSSARWTCRSPSSAWCCCSSLRGRRHSGAGLEGADSPAPHGSRRPGVRGAQVPHDGGGRRRAGARVRLSTSTTATRATRACSRSRTIRASRASARGPPLLD